MSDSIKEAVELLGKLHAAYAFQHLHYNEEDTIIAALEALRPIASGTHVIVPVEPTEAMLLNGSLHGNLKPDDKKSELYVTNIYRAMLAANTKPEG